MASRKIKDEYDDEHEDERGGLIPLAAAKIKDAALTPVRPLVSRPALKAYLTTILATLAAITLFGLAIVGYILFYYSYIPRIGFERTLHLQFDNVYAPHTSLSHHAHPYPYGTVTLAPDLVAQQGYDVWVELTLPRTDDNQDAGNFMLSVEMYGPNEKGRRSAAGTPTSDNILGTLRADIGSVVSGVDPANILATSRRPAIMPYRSRYIDLLHKLSEVPWYIMGFRSEDVTLRVPVFERISFPRGTKNIPSTLKLEIQSTHRLQIYSAKALFRARFTGIRWLMYNHRIISAILFISSFWATEMLFAGAAWATISLLFSSGRPRPTKSDPSNDASQIKSEDTDAEPQLSDTERTFPTLSGQLPLRYTSPPRDIKLEPDAEEAAIALPERVTKGAEADVEDEDEEDVDFFDSGIGTSMESSGPARRESLRRRRGRVGQRTLTPGSNESSTLRGGADE